MSLSYFAFILNLFLLCPSVQSRNVSTRATKYAACGTLSRCLTFAEIGKTTEDTIDQHCTSLLSSSYGLLPCVRESESCHYRNVSETTRERICVTKTVEGFKCKCPPPASSTAPVPSLTPTPSMSTNGTTNSTGVPTPTGTVTTNTTGSPSATPTTTNSTNVVTVTPSPSSTVNGTSNTTISPTPTVTVSTVASASLTPTPTNSTAASTSPSAPSGNPSDFLGPIDCAYSSTMNYHLKYVSLDGNIAALDPLTLMYSWKRGLGVCNAPGPYLNIIMHDTTIYEHKIDLYQASVDGFRNADPGSTLFIRSTIGVKAGGLKISLLCFDGTIAPSSSNSVPFKQLTRIPASYTVRDNCDGGGTNFVLEVVQLNSGKIRFTFIP